MLERYRDVLPVSPSTPIVTLGEGSTPLLRSERLSAGLGLELWLKLEGTNPTGSFKDRGMAVAVAKAVEGGARAIVCASTGNTAASAAAYAARAGIAAVVVHAAGGPASSKLAQVRVTGARLIEVGGTFDDAFAAAEEIAEREGAVVVNSTNPDRIEGQKTAAIEIVEELGGPPDMLALPYGGGGNTTAYAKGFLEAGFEPRLVPVEAADRAGTTASAIRIPTPVHRAEVEEALARCGGAVVSVTDDEIAAAWSSLAREEGVFCEPASAAAVAGLAAVGDIAGSRVVCVLTGHGLKDPEALDRLLEAGS
ncbi:MAG TPA: threonine synthase [Gaiellaceae bacterium]|nr:threonine synthase [Gaiellaceae bacterium]